MIKERTLTLLKQRAPKSICPSEIARLVFPEDWTQKMDIIHMEVAHMAKQGVVQLKQRGVVVEPGNFTGPYRIVLKRE
jgi:predicted transcriptional regulator